MYSKQDIERVRQAADIRDFIPNLKGHGTSKYCTCPSCGKSGTNKGLIVTHKGNLDIAKCFSCGYTINGAVNAVEVYDKVDFVTALKTVADRYGIFLQEEKSSRKPPKTQPKQPKKNPFQKSFCDKQLEASGLTYEDVKAIVHLPDNSGTYETSPFRKGGVNSQFDVNNNDDEMVIYYYDLEGYPMQYASRGIAGKPKNYIRVRWSNPEAHLDMNARPIKYQTPKGAQTTIYIPQYIRNIYQSNGVVETLLVQEGEKKAEKACKHGIPSVGIQGIYNIGNTQTGLIKELQYFIQRCKVKNVILMLDSDWNHLHREIAIGDRVDQRPNQFSKAVIKFKTFLLTMHN